MHSKKRDIDNERRTYDTMNRITETYPSKAEINAVNKLADMILEESRHYDPTSEEATELFTFFRQYPLGWTPSLQTRLSAFKESNPEDAERLLALAKKLRGYFATVSEKEAYQTINKDCGPFSPRLHQVNHDNYLQLLDNLIEFLPI